VTALPSVPKFKTARSSERARMGTAEIRTRRWSLFARATQSDDDVLRSRSMRE
jgi:hypothetical protein